MRSFTERNNLTASASGPRFVLPGSQFLIHAMCLLGLSLCITESNATVIHVYPGITCPGYPCTIQEGIASASAGDTILAAAGTYPENVVVNKPLVIRSIGGQAQTIIDGGENDWTIYFTNASGGSQLIGFTVQAGNPGGIRCSATSVVLRRLTIGNSEHPNRGYPDSYGIRIDNSSALVDSCTIQETGTSKSNSLAYGLYGINNSQVVVSNCSIINNNGGTFNGMGIYGIEELSDRSVAVLDSTNPTVNLTENWANWIPGGPKDPRTGTSYRNLSPVTALLVKDCIVGNNNWSNIRAQGFGTFEDTLKIIGCTIENDPDVDQDDAMVEIVDTAAEVLECTMTGAYTRALQVQDDAIMTEERVLIKNCEIYENKSATDGGAAIMASWPSVVRIEGNEIHHNEGRNGGTVIMLGAECEIVENEIHDNEDPGDTNPPPAIDVRGNYTFLTQSDIVTIEGNTISDNGDGGHQIDGMQVLIGHIKTVTIRVIGNTVSGNSGSGISIHTAGDVVHDLDLSDNIVLGNGLALPSNVPGGGVALFGRFSPASFVRNVIAGNQATLGGGIGLTNLPYPIVIEDCTVAQNGSSNPGTAIRAISGVTDFELHNTIIYGNYTTSMTPLDPVACISGAELTDATCLLVYANGTNYSGCLEPYDGLPDMLEEDPLFCDANEEDYTLTSNSPCLAKNSPEGCGLIGALGEGCEAMGTAASNASVLPAVTLKSTSGSGTLLGVTLPDQDTISINLYDVSGRLVSKITEARLGRGLNTISLDGSRLRTGLYFARVTTSQGVTSAKVLLLR